MARLGRCFPHAPVAGEADQVLAIRLKGDWLKDPLIGGSNFKGFRRNQLNGVCVYCNCDRQAGSVEQKVARYISKESGACM